MAVPDEKFMEMMRFYKDVLATGKMDSVAFGHIGENHLHINLLPTTHEIDDARKIYDVIVERILDWGGTVSAEHGIGKLKKDPNLTIPYSYVEEFVKVKIT